MNKVITKAKENKTIILLFILSTSFFIYQHTTGLSWDFSVYVMNAKYIFNQGHYFEWYRAPFMPFLLFLFSFAGYTISEYIYIVFVSGLFTAACIKLAEKCGFDKALFYSIMLSPFVLNTGLSVGTELLTLCLLILLITYLHHKKASLFLGLSFLARYSAIAYIPLILFKKNWKQILTGILLLIIVFSPWMYYNHSNKGHIFYSVADSYMFNIQSRATRPATPEAKHFLYVLGFYTLFLFPGLYIKWKKTFTQIDWLVIAFALLTILSYLSTPHKEPRYLFNLILPGGYFTAVFFHHIHRHFKKIKPIHLSTLLIIINFTTAAIFFTSLVLPPGFYDGAKEVDKCMLLSNAWPYLNYLHIPSHPYPFKHNIRAHIQEKGRRILLYKFMSQPSYAHNQTFLNSFPMIKETNTYIILGNKTKCAPLEKVDKSFIGWLQQRDKNINLCPFLPLPC